MKSSMQVPPRAESHATSHFVCFYHDEATLMTEVGDYLDHGLRGGGNAVVIATADHLSTLRKQLQGLGRVEGGPGWFPGELIMLDATEVLSRFMVDEWPDAQRFDDVVGAVVRQACALGKQLHAFGEMVALLCAQGLYEAAVRLEQLWNGLRDQWHFSLFCAYPYQLFQTEAQTLAFQQVCCVHDHVGPHPAVTAPQHDAFLRLAVLEQRQLALQDEVTRARLAEQTLRHREREFSDFLENAAEGLHRVAPDGTILWANAAELALLGYRWEEYVGHHIAEFHVSQAQIRNILGRLHAGETLQDQPAIMRCKDGSTKHVVINSNGCFEDGKLRYTRCFTRDATDRQMLAQAHREREALVRELSRTNEAKDEFLAMLAHELRNPLAPVAAAAQLLALAANDPDRVRQAAAVISRQVGHMTSLIDDLLDVARVTRGLVVLEHAPLDLRDIAREAIEQTAPQFKARQQALSCADLAVAAPVKGDRKRLVQVVGNILSNASKFTPVGGRVDVRLRICGMQVELAVSDNGIGMDQELRARVFDLFVQGHRTPDRSQGGLGIGLSLASRLVEAHGGTLLAASAGAGQGSTFTVSLPRLTDSPAIAAPPAEAAVDAGGTSLKLIVVDDNRDAADTLAGLLTVAGHKARALYDAQAAIEAARADCPAAFMIDIGLPDMDGFALASRLAAMPEAAGAVLIAVTGYGQQKDKERSRSAGFHHHLTKPVDATELLATLAAISAH